MSPTEVLMDLRAALSVHGIAAHGPHPGDAPEWDYLLLDGCRAYAQLDGNSCWQVLVYAEQEDGLRLVRIADPDGRDWPGDPV